MLLAGDGDDFVFGQGGRDVLFGGQGNDFLEGGSGRDTVDGGYGDDVLFADAGLDLLIGGSGYDIFTFAGNTRGGTILDWQDGQDLIDLTRFDGVDTFDDLGIGQTSDQTARIVLTNEDCREVEIELIASAAFTLGVEDFVI